MILYQPKPSTIESSAITAFQHKIERETGKKFGSYTELHRWSVENLEAFWKAIAEFTDLKLSQPPRRIVDNPKAMPGAHWFEGAKLNLAENLLRFRDQHRALVFRSEDGTTRTLTYAELYDQVESTASRLRALGVSKGDRVAGFLPCLPESVVGMLAASSIGAVWSSCSPDFGTKGILDRFGQIQPKVLFASDGYVFKGKEISCLDRVREIQNVLTSLELTIIVPYRAVATGKKTDLSVLKPDTRSVRFEEWIQEGKTAPLTFEQVPFEHPLYIMYSSGTTGLPKCMVQSVGGILINHVKEHRLHCDLKRDDVFFYFTTCGWMMWNWLVTGLATGSTLALFEGQPFTPDASALWRFADDAGISVFGTSAGYIAALMQTGYRPKDHHKLKSLRMILSTGSPLSKEGFRFSYEAIKDEIPLCSVSGGTDLNGCFALGNPNLPVTEGELQCLGLGMSVEAWGPKGEKLIGQTGELVCTRPFPSMPIHFWNDPDGTKYKSAYFGTYPGVWRHGDFIEINERGGVVIYGRSDTTLNPGGVRIGTAEIYRQVDQIPEIEDSVVIGQDWQNDVRVVLFVKLRAGVTLDEALKTKIRTTIRENTTPRHVPAKILAVTDIPYTLNMKKVELAVKNVVEGKPVTNRDALKNPESLELYKDLLELKQ